MQTPIAACLLIKRAESLRLTAYKDSGGVWTIGWGTTAVAGVGINPCEGMVITPEQAEGYFTATVSSVEKQVISLLTQQPTANQLGAMVSLTYNIGAGNFRHSSVLRYFNAGDLKKAKLSFALWNKDNGVILGGLIIRRDAEAKLFATA